MSRDGSNIYSAPAGTLAVSGTPIERAKYTAFVNDLVADANLARPVVAGGTGVTTAGDWLAAMGVTATAAELNKLDGVTASTAEMNVLDGIPGTLTATEIGYLDGVTSAIQTQLNAKQATDADLTAIAELGGTGLLAHTGAGTWAERTVTSTGGTLTITNPGGVAGNINLEVANIQWQAAISVTSGTSSNLSTAIPAGVTEIHVRFRGAELTTGDNIRLRIGPSGGLVTSGYLGGSMLGGSSLAFTSGFGAILSNIGRVGSGVMRLVKTDTNIWLYTMVGYDTGGSNGITGHGEVDAGGVVSQAQISVTGGAFTGTGTWQIGWR